MAGSEEIRAAVLCYLREYGGELTSISAMAEQIRQSNNDLVAVSDFDFRSTVLRMMAVGEVELTPTSRIAMPVGVAGG